jgi:polysaccharide biosynthesis/export protein
LLAAVLVVLSGCAEVVPGLNVPKVAEGVYTFGDTAAEPERAAAAPGSNGEWPPYGPSRVPPPPSAVPQQPAIDAPVAAAALPAGKYEVVRVTPSVVASLRQRAAAPVADAAQELPAVNPADVPPEYRIGPGDVVYITVWDHPEFSQPVAADAADHAGSSGRSVDMAQRQGRLVASDGSIYYPYIGNLHVGGKTTRELRELIVRGLERVVVDPKIDVKIVAYRAYRVQVSGEVENPGTITLDDMPKGILQAIDACGGLTTQASRRRATLVRHNERYRIDLAALLSGDAPARNLMLRPGDQLHVPNSARDSVYVLGEVNQEKPVPMHDATLPLIEALAASGGLTRLGANDSGVLVFRMNDAGNAIAASVYALDMASAEGMLLATQFPLNERDVVYVMATALSKYNSVVEQILPTVRTVWYADGIDSRSSR